MEHDQGTKAPSQRERVLAAAGITEEQARELFAQWAAMWPEAARIQARIQGLAEIDYEAAELAAAARVRGVPS